MIWSEMFEKRLEIFSILEKNAFWRILWYNELSTQTKSPKVSKYFSIRTISTLGCPRYHDNTWTFAEKCNELGHYSLLAPNWIPLFSQSLSLLEYWIFGSMNLLLLLRADCFGFLYDSYLNCPPKELRYIWVHLESRSLR